MRLQAPKCHRAVFTLTRKPTVNRTGIKLLTMYLLRDIYHGVSISLNRLFKHSTIAAIISSSCLPCSVEEAKYHWIFVITSLQQKDILCEN